MPLFDELSFQRLFLLRIHQWRKKVLVILNKIDQLRNDRDKQKIIDYVRENAEQVLQEKSVPIFPVSALKAVGFEKFNEFLHTELNDETKLKLKLENPLGIVEHIFDDSLRLVEARKTNLNDDEQVERNELSSRMKTESESFSFFKFSTRPSKIIVDKRSTTFASRSAKSTTFSSE